MAKIKGNEMQHYHNTLQVSGPLLDIYDSKAQTQDERILDWFKTYEQPASPSKLCKLVFHDNTPLTSVRRGLTNLTKRGLLVKSERQVKGQYGRNEHIWELPGGQLRLI